MYFFCISISQVQRHFQNPVKHLWRSFLWKYLTALAERFILDVLLGSECAYGILQNKTLEAALHRSRYKNVFFRYAGNLFCNFIEITLRHVCSPLNLLHIFRTLLNTFTTTEHLNQNTFLRAPLLGCFWKHWSSCHTQT